MPSTTFVDGETIVVASWLNSVNNFAYSGTWPTGATWSVPLSNGGTGASLTDPGVNKIMYWKESTNEVTWLGIGTNLSITADVLNAAGGGGSGPAGAIGTFQYNLNNTDFGGLSTMTTDGTNIDISGGTLNLDNANFSGMFLTGSTLYSFVPAADINITYNGTAGLAIKPDPTTGVGEASIKLYESLAGGSNYVSIKAPATIAADAILTLQDVTGTVYSTGGTDVSVADGGTGASTAGDARTNLGLVIGTDVFTQRTITGTADRVIVTNGDGVAGNPTLDVGANVYTVGGTDVSVADGGTGVSTMTTAYAPVCAGTTATGSLQTASTGLSTSGFVLTSTGASSLPTWQAAGDWVKISSQSASASATIDFSTGITADYSTYCITIANLVPSTDSVVLFMRTSTNGGVSYDAGATDYGYQYSKVSSGTLTGASSTGTTAIRLVPDMGTAANFEKGSFIVNLYSPAVTTSFVQVTCYGYYNEQAASAAATILSGGMRATNAKVDAIRFLMSTGNIATGIFTLYGMKA